ncbi:AEC family transporter [Litoreibacter roseus]|uniref:Malonate transporter n=1 Tax=Litoreibacter roseus TaxID=2601869 RepID=A0A6N6JG71_9RHOB|nr:AEC family transporter [Litoreibacter roseus]GFE65343.1 malonate transporter [Litoreibacter roseus]
MGALLQVILPVFLVIGFGFVAVKRNLFSPDGVDGLMKFTQNFAIPCLLFRAIADLELGAYFAPPLLISYYLPAVSLFFAGILGARLLFNRPWEHCVAIGFCALFGNTVLLGLPIMERAYGADALDPNYAIIALNSPTCYLLGIAAMEIVRGRGAGAGATILSIFKAIFRNALVIGIMLGFAVNLSGFALPNVLNEAIDLMIRAALPAAIFGLGGVLAQYRIEGDIGPVLMICAFTLILQPAATWGLGIAYELDEAAFRSAIITAAMAPGINCYVFANMYGVAKRVAASTVLIATALSVITTWGWLAVLP